MGLFLEFIDYAGFYTIASSMLSGPAFQTETTANATLELQTNAATAKHYHKREEPFL